MADVFSPTWVKSLSNIIPSGASRFIVKIDSDVAYYNLGAVRDISAKVTAISKNDSLLRASAFGFALDIKMPSLQAGLAEIKALSSIVSPAKQPAAWAITELDGKFLKDTGSVSGIHWVLNCGGIFDDYRTIDYMIKGNLAGTELDAIYSASSPTIGTPDSGDTLYTLSQSQVFANQKPNGLTKVEFKASGDAAYADLGDFNANKCEFSCLFELGGGGRQLPRVHGMQLALDIRGIETDMTKKQLQDAVIANSIDLKLTFQDGVVCTIPNTNVGVHTMYSNEGNADKVRAINLIGNGAVANWNGTGFFATDGTTAFSAMFA